MTRTLVCPVGWPRLRARTHTTAEAVKQARVDLAFRARKCCRCKPTESVVGHEMARDYAESPKKVDLGFFFPHLPKGAPSRCPAPSLHNCTGLSTCCSRLHRRAAWRLRALATGRPDVPRFRKRLAIEQRSIAQRLGPVRASTPRAPSTPPDRAFCLFTGPVSRAVVSELRRPGRVRLRRKSECRFSAAHRDVRAEGLRQHRTRQAATRSCIARAVWLPAPPLRSPLLIAWSSAAQAAAKQPAAVRVRASAGFDRTGTRTPPWRRWPSCTLHAPWSCLPLAF